MSVASALPLGTKSCRYAVRPTISCPSPRRISTSSVQKSATLSISPASIALFCAALAMRTACASGFDVTGRMTTAGAWELHAAAPMIRTSTTIIARARACFVSLSVIVSELARSYVESKQVTESRRSTQSPAQGNAAARIRHWHRICAFEGHGDQRHILSRKASSGAWREQKRGLRCGRQHIRRHLRIRLQAVARSLLSGRAPRTTVARVCEPMLQQYRAQRHVLQPEVPVCVPTLGG